MTPIEVLLSLELPDASIARRLQVSRTTVSFWRSGRFQPTARHQATAAAYLSELLTQISRTLVQTTYQQVSPT